MVPSPMRDGGDQDYQLAISSGPVIQVYTPFHLALNGNSSHRPPERPVLDRLRHDERLAVGAAEQLVGLGVLDDRLGAGVEAQGPSGAQGDVAQVTQAGALVPLL